MNNMKKTWEWWLSNLDEVEGSLLTEMNEVHPEYKEGSYSHIIRKWFTEMPLHAYSLSDYDREGGYQISLNDLRDKFNYRYKRKHYWFDWFCKHYPIWTVFQKGNQMKGNTRAMIHPSLELILDTLEPEQQVEVFNHDIPDGAELEYIAVDLENLENYIDQTEYNIKTNVVRNSGKIGEYLKDAKKIRGLALGYNEVVTCPLSGKERHIIPQPYKMSPFGRKYYVGGWALQTKNERVRTASLGRCWSIDISTSVFSFYKLMAHDWMDTGILDIMLEDKARFRNELAKCLVNTPEPYRVRNVKEALTAIGFGARDTSFWDPQKEKMVGAIANIIKNQEDRERLQSHPLWIELRTFISLFKKNFAKVYGDLLDELKEDRDIWSDRRYSVDRALSYYYQQYERKVMAYLEKRLAEEGREPSLSVHDGIYTLRNPFHNGIWSMIQREIEHEFNPLIKFDIVEHEEERVFHRDVVENHIEDHQYLIQQQELLAKAMGYTNSGAKYRPLITNTETQDGSYNDVINKGGYSDGSTSTHYDGTAAQDPEYLKEFYQDDEDYGEMFE